VQQAVLFAGFEQQEDVALTMDFWSSFLITGFRGCFSILIVLFNYIDGKEIK